MLQTVNVLSITKDQIGGDVTSVARSIHFRVIWKLLILHLTLEQFIILSMSIKGDAGRGFGVLQFAHFQSNSI
jgi:hypothetical protein